MKVSMAIRGRLPFLVSALFLLAWQSGGFAFQKKQVTVPQAAEYFDDLEEACRKDNGQLWGRSVCGPVLLIDPETRKVISNRNDRSKKLKAQGSVFVGQFPSNKFIANAPTQWRGIQWAMVMTSFLGDTKAKRVALLAHESFHCIQPGLGLMVHGDDSDHLDTLEGRYWINLEWNALRAALNVNGNERKQAVADALAFRAKRRALFPKATTRENAMELREGLAQYTGLRLAGLSANEHSPPGIGPLAKSDGIVRSFGYISGPLYGYLLDEADKKWRTRLDRNSDLGEMLRKAMGQTEMPEVGNIDLTRYDGPAIRSKEEKREQKRQLRLAKWRELFFERPVLMLDLSAVSSAVFDSRKMHPFDENQTIFEKRTLIAGWGTLEVDGGAILENKMSKLGRLPIDDSFGIKPGPMKELAGPGWKLELSGRWKFARGTREGDWVLKK